MARAVKALAGRTALLAAALLGAIPFVVVELFRSQLYVVASVPAYLVFHNVAEFFSIMVSLSVFGVGWFSHEQSRDRHALFLACAFLGVGLMDFMHAMSFTGMPDFFTANVATKTSQYWIAVRLFGAAALLASAFVLPDSPARWLSKGVLVTATLGVSAAVFTAVSFYPQHLPLTYDPAVGLTRFKVLSEYVVIALLLAAIPAYLSRARRTGDTGVGRYAAAFALLAYSELVFTVFRSMFDTFNVLGHVYKVVAFYLVYRAVFIASVQKPYRTQAAGQRRLEVEIREREAAEDASQRLNRELRAIRNCNHLMMRADAEPALLSGVCRIVCDEAGYRLAWVGYAEQDDAKTVRPLPGPEPMTGTCETPGSPGQTATAGAAPSEPPSAAGAASASRTSPSTPRSLHGGRAPSDEAIAPASPCPSGMNERRRLAPCASIRRSPTPSRPARSGSWRGWRTTWRSASPSSAPASSASRPRSSFTPRRSTRAASSRPAWTRW
jgi:hypothetical protein